jgi:hypothetical protein
MGALGAGVDVDSVAGCAVSEIEDPGGGDTSNDAVAISCRPHVPQNAPTALVPQTGQ